MSVIKGAIIGFGKLGLLHLAQFEALENSKILYICETDKVISNILKKNFENIQIISDYEKIKLEEIDFVAVTTPSHSHHSIAKYFLQKKKTVFCEKPLCTSFADAEDLRNISLENHTMLFTGYMYDFHPTFEFVYKILKENTLGRVFYSKAEMYVSQYMVKKNVSSWRFNRKFSGGGVLITQTSHILYFLSKIFGEVESVKAFTKNIYSKDNIEDYVHVMLGYKDTICSIDASWSAHNYRTPYVKFHFEGENGSIELTEDKVKLYLKNQVGKYNKGLNLFNIVELDKEINFDVAGRHYASQCNYFINQVKQKKIDLENLTSSVEVQKIIDLVYKDGNK